MVDISIFQDKTSIPSEKDLADNLGLCYDLWVQIHRYVLDKYPGGLPEWNYPGKNYGWSYRIKDKKRAIIYLLPRAGYFKAAFVFGQKATDSIMLSDISSEIKDELSRAKKYAEGLGIRIDINNDRKLPDIKKLIEIKLEH